MTTDRRLSLWFCIPTVLIVYVAGTALFSRLLQPLQPEDPGVVRFVTYSSGFLLALLYAAVLGPGRGVLLPSFSRDKWKFRPALTLAGLILMVAASIVLSPLVDTMPEEYMQMLDTYMQGGFWPMFTVVAAAPLLEEALFRGVIQKNIASRLGPAAGIGLGALIFGIIHLIPQQVLYATCLGLILGSIYYLSGSLISAITVHFVNNGLTSLLYLFFGTSTGLERQVLGSGALWRWTYFTALALLLGALIYMIFRLRKEAENRPAVAPEAGDESPAA